MRPNILILSAFALALLLAACGGGGSTDSTGAAGGVAPQATNSVAEVAAQLEAAAKTGDCRAFSQLYLDPQSVECTRKLVASTKVSGNAQYETGGVIDVSDAVDPALVTYVLAVDASGRFGIQGGELETETSVDSQPNPKNLNAADTVANDVIDSLREKDCDKFFENVSTSGVKAETCATAFSHQNPTIDLLSSDKSMKPEYLGGNADVAFYALSFNDGETYLTMPVVYISQAGKYLGLVPVPAT